MEKMVFFHNLSLFEPWQIQNYLKALKLEQKSLDCETKKIKKEIRRVKQSLFLK